MSLNWITDLEQKVESAATELESTRKENRALKKKVQRLQQQILRETRSVAKAGAGDPARAAWDKERRLIRRRVSKLAESLQNLL